MKGIILAGGSGTRLYPITKGISKQAMPIYDKPMIYYPLSVLMQSGIRDILIITTEKDQPTFKDMLGNGSDYGLNLEYCIQPSPDGLAQAFILGEEFIGDDTCAMILGDNIYHGGDNFKNMLQNAKRKAEEGKASIFGYHVKDPQRFGIMELDDNNNVLSVEEKPKEPKSEFAITGLYFYPKGVSEKAKKVVPSPRGELEITSLNAMYLEEGNLRAELLDSGFTWFDTGTHDSMMEASEFVQNKQKREDIIIACPEIIAYDQGWIDESTILEAGRVMQKNAYGQYLTNYVSKKKEEIQSKPKKLILTNS